MKVDISGAFETLNQDFMRMVLQLFGFNTTFCNWISCIIKYNHMFILINGHKEVY